MKVRALVLVLLSALSSGAYSECVPNLSKELTFSDGSKACLEDFEPLNLDIGTNIAGQARRAKTHSYAIPMPGSKCLASSGWSWNSFDDDGRAVRFCEEAARRKAQKQAVQDYVSCKCFAIAPVNGKVNMAQKEFVSLLFSNSYGLLDQNTSNATIGREAKKTLQEKEQLHYQRLAMVQQSGRSTASAPPQPAGDRSDVKAALENGNGKANTQNSIPGTTDHGSQQSIAETSHLAAEASTVGETPASESSVSVPVIADRKPTVGRAEVSPAEIETAAQASTRVEGRTMAPAPQGDVGKLPLRSLEASCKDVDYPDKIAIEAIFYELEENRLEEAHKKATTMPNERRTEAFRACSDRIQTWLAPRLTAYRENKARLAADQRQAEQERQQQAKDPVKGCELLVLQFGERFAYQASPKCRDVLEAKARSAPPEARLEEVYGMYLMARDCYDVRKEFKVPYVTQRQFDTVKAVTQKRENKLVMQFPALSGQKDAIWEKTKREYVEGGTAISSSKYNSDVHDLCRRVVTTYTTDEAQRASEIKKDF